MITVPRFEDMPPEERALASEATELRQKNAQIAGAMESYGAEIETGSARLEHLLLSLVELKVITMLQMWQINLDWEKNLNSQLRTSLSRLEDARAAAERAKGKKKLYIPGRG